MAGCLLSQHDGRHLDAVVGRLDHARPEERGRLARLAGSRAERRRELWHAKGEGAAQRPDAE